MAQPLFDRVLADARTIIADRRRRLRCSEAVTAQGGECDACDPAAARFCAVGALINAAYDATAPVASRVEAPHPRDTRRAPKAV